jgi:5-methylcytosine-specific restriction endonuclease McrA
MLFNYRYVNHSIERFQVYLDHLVKEVWCKATANFSLDLLHPELKLIVEAIFYDGSITKDHLDGPIRRIYEIFKTQLSPAQRQQVSTWYDHNNDIEALCAHDPSKPPATYADIRAINADLEAALKDFCNSLFTDVINLKSVTSRIGGIDAHYISFVAQNTEGKCPYCGYSDIKGEHNTRREAYDHFLPKSTYPFNSVNFRNLAPMCRDCNSAYKLQKDPMRHIDPISRKTGGTRRKAFYSYAAASSGIAVSVTIKTKDVTNLQPSDIDLQLTSPGHDEEVEAWKDVFGIEERYKAKFCAKNDGKAWLQHIVEESKNGGLSSDQLLAQVLRAADRSPYDSANFLKKPFLTACQNANII